jgi:hypothetical protein
VKFFEAESSLFMLTAAGVYELDHPTTGVWRLTGSPAGLQGTATLRRTTSETGFATANGQWAYRIVWAYRNANNRLQLSAPSGRFLLTAPANVTATAANISKTAGTDTVTVINTTHGFVTGEYVDVTLGGAEANFAAGRFQVTRVSDTSFTYADGGSAAFSGNPGNSITYGFTSRNVTVSIPIPSTITGASAAIAVQYFAQVYRSAKSADANTEASDSMALVYERAPTNVEITAGVMSVTDITPDEIRNTELYTSLSSLLEAKSMAPRALTAATFREATFFGGTANVQTLDFGFLAVGGTFGVQTGDFFAFSDSPDNLNAATWTVSVGCATSESDGYFKLFTTGSTAQNIADTAKSFVRAINGSSTNSRLEAEYLSTDTEAPGRVLVRGRNPTIGEFSARISNTGGNSPGRTLAPTFASYTLITDMARAGTTVTVNTVTAHGYAVGQSVELAQSGNSSLWPDGVKTVASTPTSTRFTYTEAGTASGAVANSGIFLDQPVNVTTSNNRQINNGLMWTPPGEPSAVPLVNFDTVGPSEATIYELLPTQDHLLVLTDKGAYQVNGNGVTWSISEFDVSLKTKGKRLAAIGSNKGYTFADQGFAELGESARIISGRIDKDLRALLASASSDVATYGFALANDGDGLVYFFLPSAASDTSAKQVYVYRPSSREFTRWELTGGDGSRPVAPFAGGWAAGVLALAGSAAARAGAAVAAPADASSLAMICPTATRAPWAASCSVSTPAFGARTSTVILSVSSSTRISSLRTASPSDFAHCPTVASTTDSPKGGTLISTDMTISS